MKDLKPILIAALGYLVIAFPLAFLWHLVLLKNLYEEIGYVGREEPIVAFGFLAILLQGFLMSVAYPVFSRNRHSVRGAMHYTLLVGLFFWTTHVLAFAAKADLRNLGLFLLLETLYLAIHFTLFGLILAFAFRKGGAKNDLSLP